MRTRPVQKCRRCATHGREDYSPETLRPDEHTPEECIAALAADVRRLRAEMVEFAR